MRPPFPGMDPWLEHPALWPDVHNRLISAIADAIVPQVAPKYFVGLESRMVLLEPQDLPLIGVPDLAITTRAPAIRGADVGAPATQGVAVAEVIVPMSERVRENYLEVRAVEDRALVTLIELLSPANKLFKKGRSKYERKRWRVFNSLTSLVEIDLLRAGRPMPWTQGPAPSDYRILVSREYRRPGAQLYTFDVRTPIPAIPLPLLPGDPEPPIDLNAILHAVYDRARYDLVVHYDRPPEPPLREGDAAWAIDIADRVRR